MFFFGKISTKNCFLKNFYKITLCWKIGKKIALLENFQIRFVGKFPQKYTFFGQFQKKICNVEKLPHTKKLLPSLTPALPHSLKMSKFNLKKVPQSLQSQVDPSSFSPKKTKATLLLNGLPYRKPHLYLKTKQFSEYL